MIIALVKGRIRACKRASKKCLWVVRFVTGGGKDEKIETNILESCPKCGKGAFYRMPPDEEWRCYFWDPPPIVRRMQERLGINL